jgi:hypothetical protein
LKIKDLKIDLSLSKYRVLRKSIIRKTQSTPLTTRICSSRSGLGETSDGAPIVRSSPRWFTEEQHHYAQVLLAAQQHDDAVDAGRSGFTPARSRAA